MRVCLVNPPSGFLLDERVFVSLGLLKVASALEAAGHEVRVLDLSGIANYLDPLRDYLAAPRTWPSASRPRPPSSRQPRPSAS